MKILPIFIYPCQSRIGVFIFSRKVLEKNKIWRKFQYQACKHANDANRKEIATLSRPVGIAHNDKKEKVETLGVRHQN
jgi:hypothetical protein